MKRLTLFISILLILSSNFYVFAQANNDSSVNSTNPTPTLYSNDNSTPNTNSNLTGPWNTRCQAINQRVEGRIRQYEENKDKHYGNFNNLVSILDRVIAQANQRGFDTSALKEDKAKLEELMNILKDDYEIFIIKLANTRNYTCGHSEGQYKNALNESKNQLKVVREDAEAIKEFYKTTVKEDIEKLKEQSKLAKEERQKAREENRSVMAAERKVKVAERETKFEERKTKFEARVKERESELQARGVQLKTRLENARESGDNKTNRVGGRIR